MHLPSGKTRLAENVLKTDVLIFEPGSDLEIGKVDASYVTIIAKNIHIQDGNVMSRIKVVREEGIDGANGADGEIGLRHGANGLCCTNGMRDSLFESSGVATLHEQLVPYEVQNQKLAFVQHGAEEARFAIDLV